MSIRNGAGTFVLCALFIAGCGGGGGGSDTSTPNPPTSNPPSNPPPVATAPSAPSSLSTTTVSPNALGLAWTDASNNETAFVLERRIGSASFAVLAELPADTAAYSDTTVSPDTEYSYRVRARNAAGDSTFSNTLPVRTPAQSSGGSATLNVAANTIEFNATNLTSTPDYFFLTGSVSGTLTGTLYVRIEVDGDAVTGVTHINVSQSAGTATGLVWPRWPGDLGVGTHHGTITVSACINDSTCASGHVAGSPRVIAVNYNVTTSVQGQIVAPHIVPASVAGTAILRSAGLGSVSAVAIGGSSATADSVSPTEMRASHPALAAGTHSISLDGGATPFSAVLHAVAPPSFAAQTLAYPTAPTEVGNVLYDAQRQSLLVVARHANSATNQLLKYSYDSGSWLTPTFVAVPALRDIAFSPDGARLLAVTDTALVELDAQTYAVMSSATPTGQIFDTGLFHLEKIVVANDGYAIVTAEANGSGNAWPYLYSTQSREFAMFFDTTRDSMSDVSLAASGDGARVLVMPWSTFHYDYDASAQLLSRMQGFRHSAIARPVLNADATRMLLIGTDGDGIGPWGPLVARVHDAEYGVRGTVPATARAAVFSPDSSRLYTFDSSNQLRTFDVSADLDGGAYPEVGTAIALGAVGSVSTVISMTLSPDGSTVFVAGNQGLRVQPAP